MAIRLAVQGRRVGIESRPSKSFAPMRWMGRRVVVEQVKREPSTKEA